VGVEDPDTNSAIPENYLLSSAYPNPFNPQTTISYDLPQQTTVTLRIFDARGRLVATPLDGHVPAGPQAVSWDARDRASGIYFAELKAGEIIETRKMMLLK